MVETLLKQSHDMKRIWLTIKDVDGTLLPKAILEKDDAVGREQVEKKLQQGDSVARVEIVEVE